MKPKDIYGENRTGVTVTRVCLASQMWAVLCVAFLSLLLFTAVHGHGKPSVDPGLFMIMGVKTCRDGNGYCLMGLDCTLDDDFVPDDTDGHCNGLKNAFTPSAHFTCCKTNPEKNHFTTTKRPRPGLLKPTTMTTTASTTAASTTTIETTSSGTSEEPTTPDFPDSTMQAATITEPTEIVDVFVDINNEVIKEIVPPALDKEDQHRPIYISPS